MKQSEVHSDAARRDKEKGAVSMNSTGGYWVIRTWQAGQVGEKVKFWVPGEKPSKSARKLAKEAKLRLDNEQSAERRAARIIHANFGYGDYLLTLDYSDLGLAKLAARAKLTGGEDEGEWMNAIRLSAEQELRNLLRRARRAAEQAGVEIRLFAVTSDMDGKTGEVARIHHHLVVNREAAELIHSKWGIGGAELTPLERQKEYTGLATYLMAQVRRIGNEKKYISSRNLKRPIPKDRTALSGAELRLPKGAEMLYRGAFIPGRPQYIRYYTARPEEVEGHLSVGCADSSPQGEPLDG